MRFSFTYLQSSWILHILKDFDEKEAHFAVQMENWLEMAYIAKKWNGLGGTFHFHSRVARVDKKARILPPFIIYVSRVQTNIRENALK